jgi:hypothetical protein
MSLKKHNGSKKKRKDDSSGRKRALVPTSDRAFETQKRAFDTIAKMRHDDLTLHADSEHDTRNRKETSSSSLTQNQDGALGGD